MDKNLTRKCSVCGEKCVAYLKLHYLGVRYVETCKCGTRLCHDPMHVNWTQYSKTGK